MSRQRHAKAPTQAPALLGSLLLRHENSAMLFAEAARSLGFGARLVSGYLQPADSVLGSQGAGSTHAWAEIYVPGAGWIAFDPTNGTMGSFNLIPVAVARDIQLAIPVAGGFGGPSDALTDMLVEVSLRPDSKPAGWRTTQ